MLLLAAIFTDASVVQISNLEPKRDIGGEIVNAHDGTYRLLDGYWYYHSAEYGLCAEPRPHGCTHGGIGGGCGFHGDHNVSIWRSADLSLGSWKRVGTAAHCATDIPDCGILYRPHLVQNPKTNQYLLYVNYVRRDGSYGGNAVFSASHPAGPFALVNPAQNLARLCPGPAASTPCGESQGGAGDFDVFVDHDGQGYIAYGANFYLSVEKLTPDLLNSTGENASFADPAAKWGGNVSADYFVEAPALFERSGTYYLLYGHTRVEPAIS